MTAALGPGGPRRLRFCPATRDHLGIGSAIPLIGIPNFVKQATEEQLAALPTGLYFAVADKCAPCAGDTSASPSGAASSALPTTSAPRTPPGAQAQRGASGASGTTAISSIRWAGLGEMPGRNRLRERSRCACTPSTACRCRLPYIPLPSFPPRSCSSLWSLHSYNLDPPEALGGLSLGPMLGSGGEEGRACAPRAHEWDALRAG